MSLSAEMVTDAAGLDGLRPAWEALWRATPDAAPFQSPAWMLAWWRQFGTDMPRVAVLRDGAAVAGLLPLYVLEEAGRRKLLPVGAGLTDYQAPLLLPGSGADAAALLCAALDRARADGTEACDLIDVPPDSALRGVAPPPGWRGGWAETDPCPVLAAGAGLREAVPARMLRKLRMNRHRAERIGGWVVEDVAPATLDAMLDDLIRLHGARWTARGEAGGVFADPRVGAFLRDAAAGLLACGVLRLQALRLRGEVAAVHCALTAPGRLLLYVGGFDDALAFHSPGTLLLGHMIEQAQAEGREIHFLRGAEGYKYAWGARDRMNAALHLEPA